MSLTFLDNILSDTITEEEYLKERRARSHSSASVVQGVITNVKLFCCGRKARKQEALLINTNHFHLRVYFTLA